MYFVQSRNVLHLFSWDLKAHGLSFCLGRKCWHFSWIFCATRIVWDKMTFGGSMRSRGLQRQGRMGFGRFSRIVLRSGNNMFGVLANLNGGDDRLHAIRIGDHLDCVKRIWYLSPMRLCEQRRFRRACASAQSRQNLCCSPIQAVSQEDPSDRKPDPWPLWMAGHAQLKSVMTECSKTQIRLTGLIWNQIHFLLTNLQVHVSPSNC